MGIRPFQSWNYIGNYGISIWEYAHSHLGIIMVIMVFQYGNTPHSHLGIIMVIMVFQYGNTPIPILEL